MPQLKNLLCCRRSASHSVSYFKKQDQRKGVYEQMQGELAAETIQRLLRDRRTGLGTRWEQLKNGEKHAKEQTVNGLRWTDLGHFKQATLMELDWRPEEGLPPEVAMEREKNKKLADLLSQRIEERLVRLETETKDMGFDKKKAKIYDELHKNLLEEEDLNKIGFDKIPPGVCIQVAMRKVEGVNLYDKGFKAENMVSEANAKKAKERESKAGDKKTSDEEESQGGEQAAPADPIETPEWLRKVDAMYKAIDSDGSGRVQEHEFVKLRMIGVKMTEEELSALFHLVDIEDGLTPGLKLLLPLHCVCALFNQAGRARVPRCVVVQVTRTASWIMRSSRPCARKTATTARSYSALPTWLRSAWAS